MKKDVFWKIYGILIALTVVLSVSLLVKFWNFLEVYEMSQSKYEVKRAVSLFEEGNTEELMKYMKYEVSSFESDDTVKNYIKGIVGEGVWTYRLNLENYNKDTEVYKIFKNDKLVANIIIEKQAEKGRYNTSVWKLSQISDILTKNTYLVTAPSNSTIYINGIKLTDEYIKEKGIAISTLSNSSKYVSVPTMVKYSIPDLITKPQIKAVGGVFGNELKATEESGLSTSFQFESNQEFNNSQESKIIEFTKKYGAYVTNEVKFAAISSFIKPASYAYTFLKGIASTNIWYPAHSASEFIDLSVHDYQMYNSDCFSCEVSFTLSMTTAVKNFKYPTNLKYYFVKTNNEWYVADFVIK